MKIVILGGGIAGLAMCHELNRRGMLSTVLEKAAEFKHVGAGTALRPNAMRVLQMTGLDKPLLEQGLRMRRLEVMDQEGRALGAIDFEPLYAQGVPPGVMVHRGTLHEVLQHVVPSGAVRMGVHVTSIDRSAEAVQIHTRDHGTIACDLLIGADGIHSQAREIFWGVSPRPIGIRTHLFVVPNRDRLESYLQFLGVGQSLGLMPLSADLLSVYTTFTASPDSPDPSTSGDSKALRSLFRQFTDARVQRALSSLQPTDHVVLSDISEVTLEMFVQDRVALIGDAAHVMSPSMGSGSALALEDAFVLAEHLAQARDGQWTLEEAVCDYYRRRVTGVETIRMRTRLMDQDAHEEHASCCARRNRRIAERMADVQAVYKDLRDTLLAPL